MQHQFHCELLWTFLEANWQYAPISIFIDHLPYAIHLTFITLNPQKTLSITHVFESQLRSRVRLALSRWSGTPAYARSTIAPALQRFTFCQTRSISWRKTLAFEQSLTPQNTVCCVLMIIKIQYGLYTLKMSVLTVASAWYVEWLPCVFQKLSIVNCFCNQERKFKWHHLKFFNDFMITLFKWVIRLGLKVLPLLRKMWAMFRNLHQVAVLPQVNRDHRWL